MSNVIEELKSQVEDLIALVMEEEGDEFEVAPIHTGVVFIHEGRIWFELGGPTYCNSFISAMPNDSSNIYPYETAVDVEDIKSR